MNEWAARTTGRSRCWPRTGLLCGLTGEGNVVNRDIGVDLDYLGPGQGEHAPVAPYSPLYSTF